MGSGRRVEVAGHLGVEQLFERYRSADDAVVKAHLRVIWQKAQGRSTGEVARNTGFKVDWVRRLLHRYNRDGPDSLGDRRRGNGREPLLSEEQRRELLLALSRPAPDGGLWTSGKVARWMEERIERKVWPQRGWVYLRDLGMRLQRPRPRHVKADPAAQEAFKKTPESPSPPSSRASRRASGAVGGGRSASRADPHRAPRLGAPG